MVSSGRFQPTINNIFNCVATTPNDSSFNYIKVGRQVQWNLKANIQITGAFPTFTITLPINPNFNITGNIFDAVGIGRAQQQPPSAGAFDLQAQPDTNNPNLISISKFGNATPPNGNYFFTISGTYYIN